MGCLKPSLLASTVFPGALEGLGDPCRQQPTRSYIGTSRAQHPSYKVLWPGPSKWRCTGAHHRVSMLQLPPRLTNPCTKQFARTQHTDGPHRPSHTAEQQMLVHQQSLETLAHAGEPRCGAAGGLSIPCTQLCAQPLGAGKSREPLCIAGNWFTSYWKESLILTYSSILCPSGEFVHLLH